MLPEKSLEDLTLNYLNCIVLINIDNLVDKYYYQNIDYRTFIPPMKFNEELLEKPSLDNQRGRVTGVRNGVMNGLVFFIAPNSSYTRNYTWCKD